MIPPKVAEILRVHGLRVFEHEPGSTPTAPLAAEKLGVKVGQIAKSLLFRGRDGSYCLIVCAGDRRVSNAGLKSLRGTKCRMAGAEEALEVTGYPPGGVCPFGLEGVDVYIDDSLFGYELVYPAGGNDCSGVEVSPAKLLELSGGRRCSVCDEG